MDHRVYSLAMKINRHGRAKVLTQSEIQLIFSDGLDNNPDRNEKIAGIAPYLALSQDGGID